MPRMVVAFRRGVGYWPRLATPRTYREKIQWRKIFDRNPRFVELQDKLAARRLVRELLPRLAMTQTLWSGVDADSIPFDTLPPHFYLKSNHGSGFNLAVDQAAPDARERARAFGRDVLKRRWGASRREWAYSQIEPRLFAENRLRSVAGDSPPEFAVVVMDRRVVFVAAQRKVGGRSLYGYYSPDWARLPVLIGDGSRDEDVARPLSLEEMLASARAIGGMVDMLRVDFYDADGVAYFGECTVYPVSGLLEIRPRGFDFEWGARWRLARSAFFAIQLGPLMRAYRWALSLHLAQTDRNGRGTGV